MNFSDPKKCLDTINAGMEVENVRSENRRRINDMLDMVPPVSEVDADQMNLRVNVNWGEATVLAWSARRQFENAFLKPSKFFKVGLPDCNDKNRDDYERTLTKLINRPLKRDKCFFHLINNKNASIVSHGIAPQMWDRPDSWRPRYVPVENLRVATDTEVSFENLVWFAERKPYTPGELAARVFGKNKVRGWNKRAIAAILKAYDDTNYTNPELDWGAQPEKMAELMKQNGHYWAGDAVPTINLWNLYYIDQRESEYGPWRRYVLPGSDVKGLSQKMEFLYQDGDRPFAEKLEHFFHCQFGDLSNKSPFLYHSVRSLGFMLMEPCFWTNMTRCRLLQHVFENFNIMLRSQDPTGSARAMVAELFDRAIIPEGISIVPQDQRHQIDPNLVNSAMAQLRQLMSESSASYTQNVDTGTKKQQTAYETAAKVQTVNVMTSALLFHSFAQETFAYTEICRRFCNEKSKNPDIMKFQRACVREGVPRKYLNVDEWEVQPEIPIGSGNQLMEDQKIRELMAARPMFPPQGQQEILHLFTASVTGDSKTADRLVPLEAGPDITDAKQFAIYTFGVLMQGVMVPVKEDLNLLELIQTYLGLTAGKISSITNSGGNATMEDIIGLRVTEKLIGSLIGRLAQDKTEAPQAKMYGEQLGKLMNEVKGFEQRLSQASKNGKGNGMDPKDQAEIATMMSKAQVQNQLDIARASQKQDLRDQEFALDQQRKNAETAADIQRENAREMAAPRRPSTPEE